jgi:hypothetical protein
MPPQVSITVTEKTAVRREWGRLYLPSPRGTDVLLNTGRIDTTVQNGILNATLALYDGAAADDFMPVVYSPTRKKVYGVEKLQVDDLFDVQRGVLAGDATYGREGCSSSRC